jgi:glycosyltransferase involved in cell wall biosynthesis
MPNKTLTLTIVIPVYNEQGYLKACFDSIATQSVLPDEVIVVDNNSTDNTVEIAGSYSFVRLLHEPNQHQSFAQKTGFNAVKSDIIGRVDADSVLPANWVKNVLRYFEAHPDSVGITGATLPYDMSSARVGRWGFSFYINLASKMAGHRMLWGANCALRRSVWQSVSGQVMTRGDIWEDYDLSFCLAPHGQLHTIDTMDIDSSFRAVRRSLITQTRYQFRAVRTFYFKKGLLNAGVFMVAWSSLFLLFVPVMLDKYIFVPLLDAIGNAKNTPAEPVEVVQLEAE